MRALCIKIVVAGGKSCVEAVVARAIEGDVLTLEDRTPAGGGDLEPNDLACKAGQPVLQVHVTGNGRRGGGRVMDFAHKCSRGEEATRRGEGH